MAELSYPFAEVPEPGGAIEILPGIKWLRMTLPLALDHINLYLLRDCDGWWLVDTGLGLPPVRASRRQAFDGELEGLPLKAVLCTHMHPDHVGQAGWLCDHWRIPLYMTQAEYLTARSLIAMTVDDLSWTAERYYGNAGMPADYFASMRENFRGFGSVCGPLPGAYQRLEDGASLRIGATCWRVIVGRGHSPEHACLYSDSRNVLISGDQVIPRITSNVSVSPMEPNADPLRHWLDSHRKFIRQVPADALVLPAHNTPFYGLHHRLRGLVRHHEERLLAIAEACSRPRSARELLPVLFRRKLDGRELGLALGETIAHLNHLLWRGQLERGEEDGVHRYLAADSGPPRRPGARAVAQAPMEV